MNYIKLLQINDSFYDSYIPLNLTVPELIEFARTGVLKLIVNYESLDYETDDRIVSLNNDFEKLKDSLEKSIAEIKNELKSLKASYTKLQRKLKSRNKN